MMLISTISKPSQFDNSSESETLSSPSQRSPSLWLLGRFEPDAPDRCAWQDGKIGRAHRADRASDL